MSLTAQTRTLESTLTPDQASRAFSWSRVWMLLALLLCQGLTLAGLLWAERLSTARILQRQAETTLEQLGRVTSDNIRSYLQTGAQVVQINREILGVGMINPNDSRGQLAHFQTLLDSLTPLNGVLLGHADGRFTFVRRNGEQDLGRYSRVIDVTPRRRVTTTTYGPDRRVTEVSAEDNRYDPRKRPWYKLAVASPGKVIWTEPYVFSSSKQPGITAATAFRDQQGALAVVGVDVQLRNLAKLLESIQISPNGRAFITDGSGFAIATSRAWPVTIQDRVPTLQEVGDPALRGLITGRQVREGATHYAVDGKRYAAVVRGVDIQPGMHWQVGVYAPISDFTQVVDGTSRRHLLFILAFMALGFVIAWPLVARATRPLVALHHQATTDALTGLRNRASFLALVEERLVAVTEPSAEPAHLGLAIFDLDGFKRINDEFGHPVGDEVLYAIGARMLGALRPGDTLGRLGGDEFALLTSGGSREELRLKVEGVLHAVARRPVLVGSETHELTITAGLAFLEPHEGQALPPAEQQSALMARADHALMRGKRREKGRVWVEGEGAMPTLFR